MRTSAEARVKNRSVRAGVKSKRKAFLEAMASKNKEAADKALRAYNSALDTAAKQGVIKKNNSARHKTRATNALSKLA